ncbi:MAG: hypothetical protein Q8R37_05750 [Nanoarchaeota archaeon]|nr:hypothetical protein [Nanoarchaeota archaeon]
MNHRQSHQEQVERWARFVKDNPQQWQEIHTQFINALFDNHDQFLKKMLKTKDGKEKLIKLYNIKNKEGYDWLK